MAELREGALGKSLARVLPPPKVRAKAGDSPLRTVVDADDVAVAIMGAITHLRVSTGTTVLVDGGWHL